MITPIRNPLRQFLASGAISTDPALPPEAIEFVEYGSGDDAVEIVTTFGNLGLEYSSIRKAAGLIDLPHRAIVEVGGKDRHTFLGAMLTNQTYDKQAKTGLAAGAGVYSFLLNGKGRIVADMNLLELGDRLYLDIDDRLAGPVVSTLEKYIFSEQVKFTRRVDLHQLAVHGPGAAAVLGRAGADVADLVKPLHGKAVELLGQMAWLYRDDPCGVPGYVLVVPEAAVVDLWKHLVTPYVEQTNKRELRPVGWLAFNTTRIEAGRPLYGIDFDDTVLPAESGRFEEAVSVTKGCYLGQEVVARMYARQQVARKVVGLRVDDGKLPIAGSAVYDETKQPVGVISSSTVSPTLSNAAIAIALVKKPWFEIGKRVLVPAEGEFVSATVVRMPFVA